MTNEIIISSQSLKIVIEHFCPKKHTDVVSILDRENVSNLKLNSRNQKKVTLSVSIPKFTTFHVMN